MELFDRRREMALRGLRDEGLDALLASNPVNVTYLTGFTGDSSCLILAEGRTILVSDGRFTTQLAEECPGLALHIRPPSRGVFEAVADALNQLGPRAVGFESGHLTVADQETLRAGTPAVSWKGERDRVERLRAIKDEDEVGQIRQAIRIAERAFAMFRAMLRPGDTEKDLADALEAYVRRAGGRCTSFPSIVAVGERSALPHAPPTARAVPESGLVLVDWGASGPLYKSDLTRILVTRKNSPSSGPASPGQPGPRLREIHAIVLEAQRAALRVLRPGVKAGEVDAAARAVITAAGHGEHFTHSLGHGLGLQVHEAPLMRPGSEAVLQAGMVVTVEPGIYVPGWGGVRIEDDVLITADGCAVLTSVPRELEALYVED
jgi:Xaa-Pro aminopeptidase